MNQLPIFYTPVRPRCVCAADDLILALQCGEDATNFLFRYDYTGATDGGDAVLVYLDLVVLLNFLVDFLLLVATNRLCGYPMKPGKAAFGALVGAAYAGMCMLPGFLFMGNLFWRMASLGLMCVIAFGWNPGTWRRSVLFVFLSMALGGIALCMGRGGFWVVIVSAAVVCLMCVVGFRGKAGGKRYVCVKLTHDGITRELTALHDTGNGLKDPISGQPVLVVGAELGQQLLGLTLQQLKTPIETMQVYPESGFRLIPYSAVGKPSGILLAARLDSVQIDGKTGGNLVAFAPQTLESGEFQALTGGI